MIPVIICGGYGTKLWPISRKHKPKHFLPLIGEKSLFQINYESLRTKFKPEEIYVSTNIDQSALAQEQAPEIPLANFIIEPEMRNQGPATGLIAAFLFKKGLADEPFMLVQADDLREPTEDFIKTIMVCDSLARRETKYITGGLKPDYPVMGVDYLVKGKRVTPENEIGVFEVAEFIWRGTKEQTEELIKKGSALIHTNHTCMTPRNLLNMLKKYKPEWYEPLMNIVNGADMKTEFVKMPPGPLEDVTQQVYAAGEALVVEHPFKWIDIGTFESLDKYLRERGLYKATENIVDLNGKSNFVKLDDPNKIVALIGVDNLVVVDTGDVLLICQKSQTGQVGEALKEVNNRKLALT
ncbi:MAG TPA: sugar phosphate nucleotidyltransferase [Candidatus Saccharimonadales bacterium]|jgi:mannose-1-phosphate guanylyltransferase|nr:sugar phosphate nucleotidyltransferase [Candidatus Saccharimonadales bacterium]